MEDNVVEYKRLKLKCTQAVLRHSSRRWPKPNATNVSIFAAHPYPLRQRQILGSSNVQDRNRRREGVYSHPRVRWHLDSCCNDGQDEFKRLTHENKKLAKGRRMTQESHGPGSPYFVTETRCLHWQPVMVCRIVRTRLRTSSEQTTGVTQPLPVDHMTNAWLYYHSH